MPVRVTGILAGTNLEPCDELNEVMSALNRHPQGLTTGEVARFAGCQSLADTARALQELREQKLVELRVSRWRSLRPDALRPLASRFQFNKSNNASRGRSSTSATQTSTQVCPAIPKAGSGTRWDMFRRMCLYYSECARLEEKPHILCGAEKENKDFVLIDRPVDWLAVATGQPITLILDDERAMFVRSLKTKRREHRLFLGAPVYVHVSKKDGVENRLIKPVFVIQVEYELQQNQLVLLPDTAVEVNHDWLESRFKKVEDREDFLEVVGLSEEDEEYSKSSISLQSAFNALGTYFKDFWQEPGNLKNIDTQPTLETVPKSGLYNRVALITYPAIKYNRGLINDLRDIAQAPDEDLDCTALSYLFPHKMADGAQPADIDTDEDIQLAEISLLNGEQRDACKAALSRPLTIVTGPPGTGKSTVAAHVMINSALRGQTVLFASHKHQALDAIEPKLNELVDSEILVVRPVSSHSGEGAQMSWANIITEFLTKPRPADSRHVLATTRKVVDSLLREKVRIEQALGKLCENCRELAEVNELLNRRLALHSEALRSQLRASCTVPSQDECERIVERIEAGAAGIRWLQWLQILLSKWFSQRRLLKEARRIDEAYATELGVEARIKPGATTQECSEVLTYWRDVAATIELLAQIDRLETTIKDAPRRNELSKELHRLQETIQDKTVELLQAFAEAAGCDLDQADVARFESIRGAIENKSANIAPERITETIVKALHDSLHSLIHHFPLWAVTNLSARSRLPLTPGQFDLLIIDEASQCDIGSVVPLAYRAKRAMVVGDPQQLQPVIKMREIADTQLRERYDLRDDVEMGRYLHRVNSFYRMAASSTALDRGRDFVHLRNHYRSDLGIAQYCNNSFYRKTLRIKTNLNGLKRPRINGQDAPGCLWSHVGGDAVAAERGCHSPSQVNAIVRRLQQLADDKFPGTVGVVTPFRIQANRLRDRIHKELDVDVLNRWRFVANTADAFQGDERDVILFSLVGASGMPERSLGFYKSNKNRFNVAASRARALLHIFGDEEWAATCGIDYIHHLLMACKQERNKEQMPVRKDLIGPVWEPKMAEALTDARLPFVQQYYACGYYLDFALFNENHMLNIEVDGEAYHKDADGDRLIEDIHRDISLQAAGWYVHRFWVYELREDMEACLKHVRKLYDAN